MSQLSFLQICLQKKRLRCERFLEEMSAAMPWKYAHARFGVVVMDNATFHKSNKSKALIEEKGAALLFLPPYSPDLNPIEQDFGALKKIRQYNHEKSIDDVIKYVSLIVQVTIENIIKAPLNKSVVPHLV